MSETTMRTIRDDQRAVTRAELDLFQTKMEARMAQVEALCKDKASLESVQHLTEMMGVKLQVLIDQQSDIKRIIWGGIGTIVIGVITAVMTLVLK